MTERGQAAPQSLHVRYCAQIETSRRACQQSWEGLQHGCFAPRCGSPRSSVFAYNYPQSSRSRRLRCCPSSQSPSKPCKAPRPGIAARDRLHISVPGIASGVPKKKKTELCCCLPRHPHIFQQLNLVPPRPTQPSPAPRAEAPPFWLVRISPKEVHDVQCLALACPICLLPSHFQPKLAVPASERAGPPLYRPFCHAACSFPSLLPANPQPWQLLSSVGCRRRTTRLFCPPPRRLVHRTLYAHTCILRTRESPAAAPTHASPITQQVAFASLVSPSHSCALPLPLLCAFTPVPALSHLASSLKSKESNFMPHGRFMPTCRNSTHSRRLNPAARASPRPFLQSHPSTTRLPFLSRKVYLPSSRRRLSPHSGPEATA